MQLPRPICLSVTCVLGVAGLLLSGSAWSQPTQLTSGQQPELAPSLTPPTRTPFTVTAGAPAPLQAAPEVRVEPLVQGPFRQIPLGQVDDVVPPATSAHTEPGQNGAGDQVIAAASGDPHFLGFAAGRHYPPAGERIDPELAALLAGGVGDGRPADEVFGFVMFSKRITLARIAQLEDLGVRVLGRHPHHALRVAMPTAGVDTLGGLPFVRWVGLPRRWQKIHPQMVGVLAEAAPTDELEVWISVFDDDLTARSVSPTPAQPVDVDPSGAVPGNATATPTVTRTDGWQERALEDVGFLSRGYVEASHSFRGRVARSRVDTLTALDFVQFLELEVPAMAQHDESMALINADRGRLYYDGAVDQEVVVAVVDSGVMYTHQGFTPLWLTGWDFTSENLGPFTGATHGTHVTGSMLGRKIVEDSYAGAAPGLATWSAVGRLFNLKILDSNGSVDVVDWNSVYDVMHSPYKTSTRPHILNHSWGSLNTPGGWFGTESAAVVYDNEVYDHRQLHVFAAGNYGPGTSSLSRQASAKNVVSVANVVDYDSLSVGLPGNLWTGSSRGPVADGRWKPNLVAPGRWVRSISGNTTNGYSNGQGTSMAAPHVSGVAAQYLDHHSFLRYRPETTAALLMATAIPKDGASLSSAASPHLDLYGAGRVDGYRGHFSTSQDTLYFYSWSSSGGGSIEVDIPVPAGATRLTAVLTYHEPGASVGASQSLLNDWDMWIDRSPFTAGGNTGEFFAHQSAVDNTEIRMLDGPVAATHRIKLYPDDVTDVCYLGLAVVVSHGDLTPSGSLAVTASDIYVQPGDDVDVVATAFNPEHTASAVFLDSTSAPGTLTASTVTLADGAVADLMNNTHNGEDVLLGNITGPASRSATWTTSWASEGLKNFSVHATSDNWVDRTAAVNITVDGTAPGLVGNLTSPTHVAGVWSNDPDIYYTWTGAPDNLSGVCGYGIYTTTSPTAPPAEVKDLGIATLYGETLASGSYGYYFKVNTVDNSGNWSNGHAVTGPYLIDTVDPGAIGSLTSTTHTANVKSCDPNVTMSWSAATDTHSGLAGYIGVWDHNIVTVPLGTTNISAASTSYSQSLADGTWFFHLRAVDQAGNLGPTTHFGPVILSDDIWSTYCTAKPNSLGCLPILTGSGSASLSASSFKVTSSRMLNNKTALLFWGTTPSATPFQGGWKCVAPPTIRTPTRSTGGSPPPSQDCSGETFFKFTSAYMAGKGLSAGDDVYCQVWSRDPAASFNTNVTGGLTFLVCP